VTRPDPTLDTSRAARPKGEKRPQGCGDGHADQRMSELRAIERLNDIDGSDALGRLLTRGSELTRGAEAENRDDSGERAGGLEQEQSNELSVPLLQVLGKHECEYVSEHDHGKGECPHCAGACCRSACASRRCLPVPSRAPEDIAHHADRQKRERDNVRCDGKYEVIPHFNGCIVWRRNALIANASWTVSAGAAGAGRARGMHSRVRTAAIALS
jgi:hypothetical protein